MNFRFVSSLLLGTYSFSFHVSNIKAEGVSLQSSPPTVRQTNSLINGAENTNANINGSEAKLFRRGQLWTHEEEQLLLKLREEERPWDEISEFFPERNWQALASRYHSLKRTMQEKPKEVQSWTPEEDKVLLDLRETGISWRKIAESLPERNERAIRNRYRHLKRGSPAPKEFRRRYSAEEDELLLKLAEAGIPWEERVTYFDDRSHKSLEQRFTKISQTKVAGHFSSEEDSLLIEALETGMTVEEVSQLLERSIRGVQTRIRKLEQLNRLDPVLELVKGRTYTAADFDLMQELVGKGMSWEDMAAEYFPGRSGTGLSIAYRKNQRRKQTGDDLRNK